MPEEKLIMSFRPSGKGLSKLFGELEAKVMDILWQEGEGTARDVFERLRDQGRRLSYSTIKTILERLVQKDLLDREMVARAYVYRPHMSREEFTRSAVRQIVDSLLASFTEPVLSYFVDKLGDADPERVAKLVAMIEQADEDELKQPTSRNRD